MAYSQIRKYVHKPDLATATISMKIFEDESQGLHHVIRNLPAGEDIGPDIWRFEKQGYAERKFNAECEALERRGYVLIQTTRI